MFDSIAILADYCFAEVVFTSYIDCFVLQSTKQFHFPHTVVILSVNLLEIQVHCNFSDLTATIQFPFSCLS